MKEGGSKFTRVLQSGQKTWIRSTRILAIDALHKLFREAVENAMRAFDERSRKAIYGYLKEYHGFSIDDLPNGIDKMDCGLRDIFGNSTAELLEGLIVRQLNQNVRDGLLENADKKILTKFAKDLERILSEKRRRMKEKR